MNFADWCMPESRYYEMAKELLTAEVNAAIEGFLAGGATEVAVLDGHGYGGIRGELLHPAAELMRVWPGQWPFLLDERAYDGVAWVGQHAKAGTPFAHLAHTGNFDCRDDAINTTSVGEFGRIALCAGELGIRVLFASGDRAFTEEVQTLAPGVETVAVKRGTQPDPGHYLPFKAYELHNIAAIHLSPKEAVKRIRAGAQRAVERMKKEPFGLVKLNPPYERVTVRRSDETQPPRVSITQHPSSIIKLLNEPFDFKPLTRVDPLEFAQAGRTSDGGCCSSR
jgi:D-aminopeptidase